MSGGLGPEQPQALVRVHPQARIERAHESLRIYDHLRRRPCLSVIAAGYQHQVVTRTFTDIARIPDRPEASIRGPLQAGDSLKPPVGIAVLGPGGEVYAWWIERRISCG